MAEAGAFLEQFREDERETLAPLRFGVCVGRFYEDLAQRLLKGASEGFELAGVPAGSVTEQVPIEFQPNSHNEAYLRAKRDKLGHSLHHQGLAFDEEMIRDEDERDAAAEDGKAHG